MVVPGTAIRGHVLARVVCHLLLIARIAARPKTPVSGADECLFFGISKFKQLQAGSSQGFWAFALKIDFWRESLLSCLSFASKRRTDRQLSTSPFLDNFQIANNPQTIRNLVKTPAFADDVFWVFIEQFEDMGRCRWETVSF